MTDENESRLAPIANSEGGQHLDLLTNSAPHMLSFNEKTGRATRDSHLTAPVETSTPDNALPAPEDAGESPSSLLRRPVADPQHTHTEIAIENGPQPGALVRVSRTEMHSHKELAASAGESPTTILEQKPPQMAATVFAPAPNAAAHSLLQTSTAHPVSQSAASPDNSTRAAPVFVPGLPVAPTIVHADPEPDDLPLQIPPEPALTRQRAALNAAPALASGKTATQQLKSPVTARLQDAPGEHSQDNLLANDELDAPAAPHSLDASGGEKFSISAEAIERLHTEQQKTTELNLQLDQLAAKLADSRH